MKAVLFTLPLFAMVGDVAAQPALLPKAPIYVEDSPTANDLFTQAQDLAQNQRWPEAVARFQQVIDEYPHKLITRRENEFVDAFLAVREKIKANPTLLESYRRLQEPAARAALEKAKIGGAPWEVDEAAMTLIMQQYGLCPAALDAGLLLANVRLEQADATEAISILLQLENHPDLSANESTWHFLLVVAATMAREPALAFAHENALKTSGDVATLARLSQWRQQLKIPAYETVLSDAKVQPAITLPEPAWPPLWEVSLKNPRDNASVQSLNPEAMMGMVRPDGETISNYSLTLPVARGESIFVSDRDSVWAVDRSSGRVLWRYRNAPLLNPNDPANGFMRMMPAVPEPRSVVLIGDMAVAVLGAGNDGRGRMVAMDLSSQLVGLDALTGELKWKLKTSDIDPSLSTAGFQMLPLGDSGNQGRVYALLRRVQLSGFQDSFAVVVDLRSGKPLWRRHLSSALSSNPPVPKTLARMTEQNSKLFIADPSGTICCMDGRTGSVLWLTILPEARQAAQQQMRGMNRPEMNEQLLDQPLCPPIVTEAGLIVPAMNVGWSAMVIDPVTGQRLRDLRGKTWAPVQGVRSWMVPAPGGLFIADTSLTLIDGKTLAAKWSMPLSSIDFDKRGTAGSSDKSTVATTTGWPAVTTNQILVPCRDGIVVLDVNSGALIKAMVTGSSGNLLALSDQIIVATDTSVAGCLNWSKALTRLTQEIAQHPMDCNPGLALAHVAMVAQQKQAMITGVDAALAAMNRQIISAESAPSTQMASEQLTNQLVEMCQQRSVDIASREQLFDRLAQAARSPGQQVLYHLHFGQFLQENQHPAMAMDQYQEILLQADLWATIYRSGSGTKQAGLEALVRLKALVKENGVQIYARHEAAAVALLRELTRPGVTADPNSLLELARAYPIASCAPLAMVTAGDLLAKQGRRDLALRQMRLAYRQTSDVALLARITGRVAELYLESANPKLAKLWLQRCKREHADLSPLRNGKPLSMDQWLSQLTRMTPGQTQLPSLKLPLQTPLFIKGTPIFPQNQPAISWPRDMLLVQDGNNLQLRSGRDLNVQWQRTTENTDLKALQITDEQVLLWSDKTATLSALESNHGQPLWPAVAAQPMLDELGPPELRQNNRPQEQQKILQLFNNAPVQIRAGRVEFANTQVPAGCLLGVNESVICIADHVGRIIGIDRATGQVRWREFVNMDRVDRLVMDEESLVISGANWLKTDAQNESITVLDPLTGQTRFPTVEEEDPLQWVGLAGDGLLLYVSAKQATARRTNKGEIAWRVSLPQITGQASAVAGQDTLLIISDGMLVTLDLASGNVLRQTTGISGSGNEVPLITTLDQQWYLTWPRKSAALEQNGKLLWRDALTMENRQLLAQLVGEEYVTLVSINGSMETRAEAAARRQLQPGQRGVAQRAQPQRRPMAMQFNGPVEQDAHAKPADKGPFQYQLYFIERSTGRIVEEQTLGPLPEALEDQSAAIMDNRLILGTRSQTIVIPGSAWR